MSSFVTAMVLVGLLAVDASPPVAAPPTLVERLERTLQSDDKPLALVTQIYINRGDEAKFEAAAAKAAKVSLAEEGCLAYEFHRDLEKPDHYTLIERWTGLAPLRKHLQKRHTKEVQALFAEVSTTPRTTDIFAPVDGKK
jgi:quinol monooxygenase YgiN